MSKVTFYYGTMNAGKTTLLLQAAFNYKEQGLVPIIIKPSIDTRTGTDASIASRVGLSQPCLLLGPDQTISGLLLDLAEKPDIVIVDEIHFLTAHQAKDLLNHAVMHDQAFICYGLRNDYKGQAFEASSILMANADSLKEVKTICRCGKKATHVVRYFENGEIDLGFQQIQIGGNESYRSMCRVCHTHTLQRGTI
ncbi:thymidine kinase [Thorsellia anophelis]|uniref:Thymidine kinase n=1 Tax=Thorsellia anophelis DSM 18579 TaxID=1123402 RepID=A0A1H9ZCD4_9GAMM|nr:thymidine kinase [Thorsellia anophelis]SES78715.1 thymidine kinase [Thorsellia anophelis DSM 18579]